MRTNCHQSAGQGRAGAGNGAEWAGAALGSGMSSSRRRCAGSSQTTPAAAAAARRLRSTLRGWPPTRWHRREVPCVAEALWVGQDGCHEGQRTEGTRAGRRPGAGGAGRCAGTVGGKLRRAGRWRHGCPCLGLAGGRAGRPDAPDEVSPCDGLHETGGDAESGVGYLYRQTMGPCGRYRTGEPRPRSAEGPCCPNFPQSTCPPPGPHASLRDAPGPRQPTGRGRGRRAAGSACRLASPAPAAARQGSAAGATRVARRRTDSARGEGGQAWRQPPAGVQHVARPAHTRLPRLRPAHLEQPEQRDLRVVLQRRVGVLAGVAGAGGPGAEVLQGHHRQQAQHGACKAGRVPQLVRPAREGEQLVEQYGDACGAGERCAVAACTDHASCRHATAAAQKGSKPCVDRPASPAHPPRWQH